MYINRAMIDPMWKYPDLLSSLLHFIRPVPLYALNIFSLLYFLLSFGQGDDGKTADPYKYNFEMSVGISEDDTKANQFCPMAKVYIYIYVCVCVSMYLYMNVYMYVCEDDWCVHH